MDNNNVITKQYSEIKIVDRKKINLSGIKKLVSFNPEEFLIESNLGVIVLKGEELEIIKLDTTDGVLSIKGRINSFSYMDSSKNKESSIIARLFK